MHITDQGPTLLELHMLGRVACIDENLEQLTVTKEQFAILQFPSLCFEWKAMCCDMADEKIPITGRCC